MATPPSAVRFTDGTLATGAKPASGQPLVGGSTVAGGIVGLAYGGHGASTAPLGRAALSAQGGGWRTTGSGTDTLVGGDGVVEYTASCTVTLPSAAESGVFVGKTITLIAATAGIVLTLQRAGSDTLNGGTSTVAVTMSTARSTLAVTAQSASAWGSLQPGSLTPTGARGYILDGVPYMVAVAIVSGVLVDVGSQVAATSTADPSGFGCTMSGDALTLPIGTNVATSLQAGGQYWSWTTASLGLTLPTAIFRARVRTAVTSFTDGTRAGIQHIAVGLGTGPTTLAKAIGFSRPTTGTGFGFSFTSTSGTPGNANGSSTTVEVRASILCGATTSSGFGAERYAASSAIQAENDLTAGAGLSATPTSITLYAYLQTAVSLSAWVANGLTWTVVWGGI